MGHPRAECWTTAINWWSALDHEADIPIATTHQGLGIDVGSTKGNPYDTHHMNTVTVTNHGYLVSLRHMFPDTTLRRTAA